MPNYKMTRTTFISTLTFIALLTSCRNSNHPNMTENILTQIDTSKSIKIGNFWATPKPKFEISSLYKSSGDTLSLITCEEYVYSPFGQINNTLSDSTTMKLSNPRITASLSLGMLMMQLLVLSSIT